MKTLSRRRLIKELARSTVIDGIFWSFAHNNREYHINKTHPYTGLNIFPTDALRELHRVLVLEDKTGLVPIEEMVL